jgi:hypothetical protein
VNRFLRNVAIAGAARSVWVRIQKTDSCFRLRKRCALERVTPVTQPHGQTDQDAEARIPDFGIKPGTRPAYETGILRTMKDLYLVF